jgi:hypothetical protein
VQSGSQWIKELLVFYLLTFRNYNLFPGSCHARNAIMWIGCPSNDVWIGAIAASCQEGFVFSEPSCPSHVLTSILLEHLLLRSDPMLRQALPSSFSSVVYAHLAGPRQP